MKALRSLLFIPALSTDKLAKAHDRGADALIIELEDAVPAERKAEARPMAVAAVKLLAGRGVPILLRVNNPAVMWRQDIAGMPEGLLEAVMLPKVESRDEVEALAQALARQFAQPPGIVALIENPRGVLAASDIAQHPAVVALGFGAEDYAAAIGVAPTPTAVAGPAQHVVTCAHAWGRQCVGLAASIGDVADIETFASAVLTARAMGFTGSVCIHPRQVDIVNRGFGPTFEELAWAERLIKANDAMRAVGTGAFLFEGRLIDGPIVERARGWLAVATRA